MPASASASAERTSHSRAVAGVPSALTAAATAPSMGTAAAAPSRSSSSSPLCASQSVTRGVSALGSAYACGAAKADEASRNSAPRRSSIRGRHSVVSPAGHVYLTGG
eukprot:5604042-Prymnesium_polylepis.1